MRAFRQILDGRFFDNCALLIVDGLTKVLKEQSMFFNIKKIIAFFNSLKMTYSASFGMEDSRRFENLAIRE